MDDVPDVLDLSHVEYDDHELNDADLLIQYESLLRGDTVEKPVPVEITTTAPVSKPPPVPPKPQQLDTVTIQALQGRIDAYKQAALVAKRASNMEAARKYMAVVRYCQSSLALVQEGLPMDGDIPPPPEPLPVQAPPTPASVPALPVDPLPLIVDYDALISQLNDQLETCKTLSIQFHQYGNKEQALRFHKLKKSFMQHVEQLHALKSKGSPLPAFNFQPTEWILTHEHLGLGLNDLQLEIVRAWGIGQQTDVWATYDCVDTKGTTPVVYGQAEPQLQFATKLVIKRDKALIRHVERKKAVFELHKYRGWLRSSECLGKAQLPLAPLLKLCDLVASIELLDPNTRKPTGIHLDVHLLLRRPLAQMETKTTREQWVYMSSAQDSPTPKAQPPPPPITKEVETDKEALLLECNQYPYLMMLTVLVWITLHPVSCWNKNNRE
jgi:hypothetical protein